MDEIFFDFEEIKTKIQQASNINFIPKKNNRFLSPNISFSNIGSLYNLDKTNQSNKTSKQVVIKNISNLSANGIKNALNYIIKNSLGSTCLNQDDETKTQQEVLKDWQKDFSSKKDAKEAMHLIFSIDEEFTKQNLETLEKSLKTTMRKNFNGYKYIMVKHTHQNNPHIHILVNKNNLYTNKKLHFNTKRDCKNFFNQLREDFKDCLNHYNSNFSYENKYKFQRDLSFEKLYPDTQKDISIELAKNLKQIAKKISMNELNIEVLNEEIESLTTQQERLRKDFIHYKNFKIASKLKNIHMQLRDKYKIKKQLFYEHKELNNTYKSFDAQRRNLAHNDYSQFKRQKAIIDFIKQNKKSCKFFSKSFIETLKSIQSNIALSKQKVLSNSLGYIKDNLMLLKVFKDANVFKIDEAIDILNKDLNVLESMKKDMSDRNEGSIREEKVTSLDENLKTYQSLNH
ncbi:relaxase/mobilization nuclease domain-containing protein [Helicobacter sp. 13S00477-4]|uniref:relaxase/mobilization nuclease domain-containing protein n=1 Tax=Helicobacter sp. 13S00477-4 TaxID=1905759 RepID=UPI000BCD2B5E|nr:relaxase/mobilization nuclease domain-containing protein [Helicobacter sp. 13S00477-4]PAF51044.1 hypothetical protein BKH44_06525 [Helicobacter sp. 13S00477-4]